MTAHAPGTPSAPGNLRARGAEGRCPALALDAGSARTRIWMQGEDTVLDVPTAFRQGTATARPVHRGVIVDPAVLTALIARLADSLPARARPVLVFTTPVLSDARHYTTAVSALQILRPRSVLAVDSVKAIALDSGADLSEPLLVVDVGAHLSEVALLTDGTVTAACRGTMGTSDLATSTPAELATATTAMIIKMLPDRPSPELVDALDRGALLAGGGALHPGLVHQLSTRLRGRIQPVPQPHTAAVRRATRIAGSAQRHPALSRPLPTATHKGQLLTEQQAPRACTGQPPHG
ncbi:hypothetical protein ACFWII_23065 [Streptomyces sp. NPDC127063]|uniref:hypothetical protein n=1 Tax=Streptomyces sp. NPDC127063 TaxID=3347123 RepID=UPI00364D5A7F